MKSILEMAREALEHAAWCVQNNYLPDQCGHDWDDVIAALVREEKEAEFAKRLEDIMPVLQQEWYLKGQEAEREACAKVCEDAPEPDGYDLAERIRARG